jgi:putative tricarboxylic transport membrane protein
VPLFLYVLGIAYLGIYVASALFMAVFMIMLGSFRWWQTALGVVLVPLVAFWVFEQQFRVPLPKGPIEALLGY